MSSNNENIEEMERFSDFLLSIGEGRFDKISIPERGNDFIQIPPELIIPYDLKAMINEIYPNLANQSNNIDFFSSRAILTPKNETVDIINHIATQLMPGNEHIY